MTQAAQKTQAQQSHTLRSHDSETVMPRPASYERMKAAQKKVTKQYAHTLKLLENM